MLNSYGCMEHKINSNNPVQSYLFLVPSLFVIILFYALISSSGSDDPNGTTTHYYADLAEAFRNGELHLSAEPDPRLLSLENPYNLPARIEMTKSGVDIPVDLALYDGKFYMYWGPVPALLLIALQPFSQQIQVGDFFLAFAFTVGIFLTQSLLLVVMWSSRFNRLPKWILSLSILPGGFVLPVTLLRHEYDHARIYEAAIAGGQFFLLSGLLAAFAAMRSRSISNKHLVMAGLLWALAIGSRHTLLVPIGFMVLLTTLWIIRAVTSFITKVSSLASLYLPLALGGASLAWYNWARFDSMTETGFSYSLAGVDIWEHSSELFSNSYILQNLYNYFLHPPHFMSTFPFVEMLKGRESALLPTYEVPQLYYAQSITGLSYLFPFAIFALIPLIACLRNQIQAKSTKDSLKASDHQEWTWITIHLSVTVLSALSLLTFFFWAGMRYAGDFLPPLTVLSALGFWQGYKSKVGKPVTKALFVSLGIALAAISIFISALLAISTNVWLTDLIIHNFES